MKRSAPFVIAYGEEEFLLDRVIAKGRGWKDRRVACLDGDGLHDHEVVSCCEQGSYDDLNRVVVLDNANKVKGDKYLTAYIEAKAADDDRVVLVAVSRTEKLAKVWQLAAAKGRLEQCKQLRSYETDAIKERFLHEARLLNVAIDADALDVLILFFGNNLRRVANELQKLSFVAEKGRITKQLLRQVSTPDLPADPYEVAHAATNKDAKKALRLVSQLFRSQGEGVAIQITAGLLTQVEKLLVTRQMLDNGLGAQTIADALGISHAYPVQKDIMPRARKHTVSALLGQMNNLCKLDAQVKGAARSKRTLIELAVLSIAA